MHRASADFGETVPFPRLPEIGFGDRSSDAGNRKAPSPATGRQGRFSNSVQISAWEVTMRETSP